MKNLFSIIIISLVFINLSSAQKETEGNFLEFGIRMGKSIESDYLTNSIRHKKYLSDPKVHSQGIVASPAGLNHSISLRFGFKLFTNTHLIGKVGFVSNDEQVEFFCHSCDLLSVPYSFAIVNSVDYGIGIRHQFFELNSFSFLLEGLALFSVFTNEPDANYFGYSLHPVIDFLFTERLSTNLKFGYNESFGSYEKKELNIEIAARYKFKKKSEK